MRASQILSEDLNASIERARPLLDRLSTWRSSFSAPRSRTQTNALNEYPSSTHFAYLTLTVYIYRALLRPTVRSSRPPHIIDLEEPVNDPVTSLDEFNWDFSELREVAPFPSFDITDSQSAVTDEIFQTAENCAARVINSVRGLSFDDLNCFWHSCTYSLRFVTNV